MQGHNLHQLDRHLYPTNQPGSGRDQKKIHIVKPRSVDMKQGMVGDNKQHKSIYQP
jgi:hypothetical protein